MKAKTPRIFALIAGLMLIVMSGCALNMESHTETTGNYIGPQTLAQIQPGKSKDFVIALLGEPSEKATAGPGDEIWKWNYVEKHVASGGVIFLIGTANSTSTKRTTYVEMKDGVVASTWHD